MSNQSSDPSTLSMPPVDKNTTVQVAETRDVNPQDLTFAGVEHMFKAVSSMSETTEVAPTQRGEREVSTIVQTVEHQLTQLALTNESLVHSATVVFKELRFYDAIRLRPIMDNTYQQLVKIIGESPSVPADVKEHIPPLAFLAFPFMIDQDHLPSEMTVSVFHKEPVMEVVIDIAVRSGRNLSFSNRFKYK